MSDVQDNFCYYNLGTPEVQITYFSYLSIKTYVVGTHLKHISEVLLTSIHNICFHENVCFHGEIRQISVLFSCKKCLVVLTVTVSAMAIAMSTHKVCSNVKYDKTLSSEYSI